MERTPITGAPQCEARAWLFALSSVLLLSWVQPAACQTEVEFASFYVVSEYDEARDPAADLQMTVERAQKEGKRILLEVGGTWCGWCKLLDAVHPRQCQGVGEAGQWLPDHEGQLEHRGTRTRPSWANTRTSRVTLSFFVLEKDGTFLHAQNTGDLEEGRSYNEEVLLAFLDEWAPKG